MSAARTYRVFVAACYGDKARARSFVRKLENEGHRQASHWHDWPHENEAGMPMARKREIKRQNEHDIRTAEALVLFYHRDGQSSICEATMAWDLGLKVVIVGDETKLPTHLLWDRVPIVADEAEAIKVLR